MKEVAAELQGSEHLSPGERLDSWKEISQYLKRTVRTVQRWEQTESLPVHRIVHEKRSTVYAYKSELDTWWMSRQATKSGRLIVPEMVTESAPPARPKRADFYWIMLAALALVVAAVVAMR